MTVRRKTTTAARHEGLQGADGGTAAAEMSHGGGDALTVRELLNQCRTALAEITAIEHQIDKMMTIGGPTGGAGGGIRREKVKGKTDEYTTVRRTNNPEAAKAQAVDGWEEALELKKHQLETMLMEMETLLKELHDGRVRTIIRYYYGVGWTDEKIAEELDTSREVITRQRNTAIDYLETRKITENHAAGAV